MNHPGRERHVTRAGTVAAALVAGALFSGCASSFDPGLYSSGGHLQARIYQPTAGMVQFAVSQPAYVAVFALVPGRGAALLHPTTQSQALRRVSPGTHSYLASNLSQSRLTYASGRSYYGSSMDGPTTLILIASGEPLHVSRIIRNPMLGSDLMLSSFYSHASDQAVLRLAELIIPDPGTTEWTYDTYTLWPNEADRRIATYRVRCADGRVVLVARGYPIGCAERVEQPPEADTSAVPSDTGRVAPPKRPLRPSEPSRRKPGSSVSEQTGGARNGDALSRRRSGEIRESQRRARESQSRAREAPARTAPPVRAQTAPPRERQQAQPAPQRPAEKSERSDRSRRGRPAS